MDLDYRKLWKPGNFDVVWSSPPCTEYSIMRNVSLSNGGRPRNLVLANSIVQRTLDIIKYLKPKYWFMENPDSGLLKQQDYMKDIPYVRADYCKYGYPYRKRTRFWGTVDGLNLKMCKYDCQSTDYENGRKHKTAIGWNRKGSGGLYEDKRTSLNQRYSIPPELVKDFLNYVS
jgi:hypothetical protein